MTFLDLLAVVCSRISGYGIHPSGIVVSDVPLADELPCMWNNHQKTQVTCFPMDDVDSRMFVKQDILGLRNLDILQDWEDQVTPEVGEIDWEALDGTDHEEDMWKLLDNGLSLGIFQIEDGYARHLCKEFRPRSIEDLGIIVALNRPGPIRSGAPDSFIARRNGEEDDKFDGRKIPILKDILEETYGWFLYQEQVIAYFSALGYDLSDADAVRKILGKKKPEAMAELHEGMAEWTGKGYKEMAQRAGLDSELIDIIWNKVADFAKYSFNKSHAIAYATIAFRTLFAKFHAPSQFFISCIRTSKDTEDAGKYVGEARRMGIKVSPPDIDKSLADIAEVEGSIYFGFANIKGIGKGAAHYLCELRDLHEIRSPEQLDAVLASENTGWERQRDEAKAEGKAFKKKSPRQTFPANRIPPLLQTGAFDNYEERDISLSDRQRLEKELLGVIVTDNCDEIFERNWENIEGCNTYPELELSDGERMWVPGIVSTIVAKRTRKENKPMGIVNIEYQGDQAEFVVFPREWKTYRFLWKERIPAIFTLSKTDRGIRFEQAERLQ